MTDRAQVHAARGRPSKLTPDTEARILSAIRCGAPNKTACEAAGVAESTLSAWLRAAKKPGAAADVKDFAERLKRAKQEGIVARLAIVQKAAQSGWRAATWLLERDCPETYSLKHRVEHSGGLTFAQALASLRPDRQPISDHAAPGEDGPDDTEEIE